MARILIERGAVVPFDEHYSFREGLVQALERDLIGPHDDDEVIDDAPIDRHIAGILFPLSDQNRSVDEVTDQDDEVEMDESTGHFEPPIARANVQFPSSFGMTFAVDTGTTRALDVHIKTARYVEVVKEGQDSKARRFFGRRRSKSDAGPWRREQLEFGGVRIDVSSEGESRMPMHPGLELFSKVRHADERGRVAVTLVLLNTNSVARGEPKDPAAFFQSKIRAEAKGAPVSPFVERPQSRSSSADADRRSGRLLYRHAVTFATGHGCGVDWDVDPADTGRASSIWTTFAPRFELLVAESNPKITLRALEIKHLAEGDKDQVISGLRELPAGYREWLAKERSSAMTLTQEFQEIARDHLDECERQLDRIEAGIEHMDVDETGEVWRAFRLMNRAMLIQRSRVEWSRAGRPEEGPQESASHRWYPFQLAFILLCIEGIADCDSPDRGMADLLWFPTGGGKTEAYLGLIAFTVFLRRMRNPENGAGVTAVMRYTLRLLTTQQFERAALLICACEFIRREMGTEVGVDEISVGLWVGRGSTPNTRSEARTSLDTLRNGGEITERNPIQLQSCPWCGEVLDFSNYWINRGKPRLMITCRMDNCDFSDGLPVFVVDEDIYQYRPTLLLATVDKFAGLPWLEKTGSLFGLTSPRNLPPELVIQDELHLISGPLGTLVGLYETAIDMLCSHSGTKPKIIASTATIRRSLEQVRGLFDREVRQFPPPGTDARDSYFAVEAPRERKAARMYVGLMAPNTSFSTLMINVYAVLMQYAQDLPGEDSVRDAYWTLLGYFNSLRVLGGARMQVQDDVTHRLGLLATQNGSQPRIIDEQIEVTSRESSAEIPGHLRRMTVPYPDDRTLALILATNMISVGVDIDRLGLMVVMGQPQSTSEYIQATSRVGRQTPGLVVTLFNPGRSRDRSHYESFASYHSALYRQVESTSVTPFSARARDRGLFGVLVAMARLLVPEFTPNKGAAAIVNHVGKLDFIRDEISRRVGSVDPEARGHVEKELDHLIEGWVRRANSVPGLVYRADSDPSKALLVSAGESDDPEHHGAIETLWSLRAVDPSSKLFRVG